MHTWPPILDLTSKLITAEKAVFSHCMQRKKRPAVFPSEVEITTQKPRYQNFVSIALKFAV